MKLLLMAVTIWTAKSLVASHSSGRCSLTVMQWEEELKGQRQLFTQKRTTALAHQWLLGTVGKVPQGVPGST